MITFKQFLMEEGGHKTAIDAAEAIKLINTHCRDALKNKQMLYRGMTGGSDAFVLHGEAGGRKSANTRNYYTVILDHFLPSEGYPKRSKSIICANDRGTARGFGTAYVLFPYDGVKIGVCHTNDLWFSPRFKIGNGDDSYRIEDWNGVWREQGLSSDSYEDFVQSIKDKMENGISPNAHMLRRMFGTADNIEPALKKAYSAETLDMHLATTEDIDKYRDTERELWIGGKCVAILEREWERLQKDDHDDELAPEDD